MDFDIYVSNNFSTRQQLLEEIRELENKISRRKRIESDDKQVTRIIKDDEILLGKLLYYYNNKHFR